MKSTGYHTAQQGFDYFLQTYGTKTEKFPTEYTSTYSYGYQGSLKDNDIYGVGNSYATKDRELDDRLARWWSKDQVIKPWESPYISMYDNPILINDVLGDDGHAAWATIKKTQAVAAITIGGGGGPEDIPADGVAVVEEFGGLVIALYEYFQPADEVAPPKTFTDLGNKGNNYGAGSGDGGGSNGWNPFPKGSLPFFGVTTIITYALANHMQRIAEGKKGQSDEQPNAPIYHTYGPYNPPVAPNPPAFNPPSPGEGSGKKDTPPEQNTKPAPAQGTTNPTATNPYMTPPAQSGFSGNGPTIDPQGSAPSPAKTPKKDSGKSDKKTQPAQSQSGNNGGFYSYNPKTESFR